MHVKRSKVDFVLALRPQGLSHTQAIADGFKPVDIDSFDPTNSMVVINLPDQSHPDLAARLMKKGKPRAWVFAH